MIRNRSQSKPGESPAAPSAAGKQAPANLPTPGCPPMAEGLLQPDAEQLLRRSRATRAKLLAQIRRTMTLLGDDPALPTGPIEALGVYRNGPPPAAP